MSPYQKKQKDKRRKNLFRKWHRRIGFTAAIFLLNLAITGILLNHSDDLELHKSHINSDWIIDLYGIKPPEHAKCINLPPIEKSVCQMGNTLYLNQIILAENISKLVSLVEFEELYYIATSQKIFIYTTEFELVEVLDKNSGLPSNISTMMVLELYDEDEKIQELVIKAQGDAWKLDPINMSWNPTELLSTKPTKLTSLEGSELLKLQDTYLAHQITMLKFVQDLHSFRFLSFSAKFITDLSGIIIIVLVLSGFYAWQRRTNKVS